MNKIDQKEYCALCGCTVHRNGSYAQPSVQGRSHATSHHFVAERFFGRSRNRGKEQRKGIFDACPWEAEGKKATFCYECHEEMLHNPVFLQEDIELLSKLVKSRGLDEHAKNESKEMLAGRIILLHEVIRAGLKALTK